MSSPTKHALLSPSSAKRWLNCTPSARLCEHVPNPSSPYAQEGTEAHALAEIKLRYMTGKINEFEYAARFENFQQGSQFYNFEFNEYVNNYCHEVMTIFKEDYKGLDCKIGLEIRLDVSDITSEKDAGGTSDVVIVGPDFIHIIDLKFGKGVPVSAVENEQMRIYAAAALKKFIRSGVFKEVRMTIIQPRLNDISTECMSVPDLNKWIVEYVEPRAKLAIAGQGELVAGDHCKFCPIKGSCQKLGKVRMDEADEQFRGAIEPVSGDILEPQNMSPEMLARILFLGPKFVDWFKDVAKYATRAMIQDGLKIPGYKLVEGRSIRVMTSPDKIADILANAGFDEEKYLEPRKLKGISILEKNCGKKLFNSLCAEYIIKPAGRPTVAPITDKRRELDADMYKLTGNEFEDSLEEDENEGD